MAPCLSEVDMLRCGETIDIILVNTNTALREHMCKLKRT